ncbi:hypothetical protein CPB84DRAFT_1777526 [Gymnopilus junonius]|uniref:Polynucleotide 5'-hydroxyl-kinase GRC3 n=1 Tax=Gymnopilus junonius TaxID=109634 RepID=A0A9P5NLM6_GYMJU|nr:hypothetical protein CPB84DRAFT_1777526 [Gymnopilus junonius]
MLSAVAARRAALAVKKEEVQGGQPIASSSTPPTPLPPTPPPAQFRREKSSKRKPLSQKTRSETKKSRKLKPFEKSNRFRPDVVEDAFEGQVDMIEVGSDTDEEGSDSGMSVLEDSQAELLPNTPKKAAGKRPWSPSQPAEESSEEEIDDDVAASLDVTSLLPHLSRSWRQLEVEAEEGLILSTFNPRPGHNLFVLSDEECRPLGLSSKSTLVALSDEDTLCLLGSCNLAVLHGSIDLFGTTLTASSTIYPIYAPRSAPLPVLRPTLATTSTLVLDHLPARLKGVLQFRAVIVLQALGSNVERLGFVCRTFEGVFGPSKVQKNVTEAPFEIPGIYMVRQQNKEYCAMSLPPSWSSGLDQVLIPSSDMLCRSYIVKGPKNSGKSTFARTLTNRLLKSYRRVAFLECDLGQSEFTPGGMVSLNIVSEPILGPPFTHPTLPNYAHFIGSNTPRSSPSQYLEAILALIQTYRMDFQTPTIDVDDDNDSRILDAIPIVVNTMGWTKGLGADLTQKIENMLEPTDIFDIQITTRDEYGFSVPPAPVGGQRGGYGAYHSQSMIGEISARLHVLEPKQPSSLSSYTAADHRSLSILSYFHAQFPASVSSKELQQVTATLWDISRPLCAIPPFQVDCAIAFDKIILTGAGSEDVVEEEIGRVLNGAVVAFVRCDPGTIDIEPASPEGSSTSATGIPYSRYSELPSPASSHCVGLGLIRGVSPPITEKENAHMVTTYLQILTPLPHSLLMGSRVLVKGEMELPVWGMLDFRNFEGKDADMGRVCGVDSDNVPYLQWGKAPEGVLGADRKRIRRNLMRRGQM